VAPTRLVVCNLVCLSSIKVLAVAFLGIIIILDQELRWKDWVNHVLTKGMKWITQYKRLVKVSGGVSAKYIKRFYLMVAIVKELGFSPNTYSSQFLFVKISQVIYLSNFNIYSDFTLFLFLS